MYILITTLGFLLIFSLSVAAQFRYLVSMATVEKVYQAQYQSLQTELEKISKERAKTTFRRFKNSKSDDDDPKKSKLVATLQLYPLITDATTEASDKKKKSLQLLLSRLIKALYGNQSFFIEAKKKNSRLEDDLLRLLFEKAEQSHINKEKNLANIDLGDEEMQQVLYKMLKGNRPDKVDTDQEENKEATADKTSEPPLSPESYPSLFDYISLHRGQSKPLSIYLASPELLQAVFQNADIVNTILKDRENIYKTLKNDKNANKVILMDQFKLRFKDSIPSDIDPSLIDFGISKTKPKSN